MGHYIKFIKIYCIETLKFIIFLFKLIHLNFKIFFANTAKKRQIKNKKIVIINSVRLYNINQIYVEILLAIKLLKNGHDVYILYDDGILYSHDSNSINEISFNSKLLFFKKKLPALILRKNKLLKERILPYSLFVKKNIKISINPSSIYSEFDIDEYVEASLVRFFLSAPSKKILEKEKLHDLQKDNLIKNAYLSLLVSQSVIKKLKPTHMISSHGIYTTWGVFFKNFIKNNIRSISWGVNGYKNNSLNFSANAIANMKFDNVFYKKLYKKLKGNKKIFNTVNHYFNERVKGRDSDINLLKQDFNKSDYEIMLLDDIAKKNKQGYKIATIFPNLMWDNASTFKDQNKFFSTPVDWLIETIKFLQSSNNFFIIIKIHPAELVFSPRVGVRDILSQYFSKSELTKNILIIEPFNKISSYQLFKFTNIACIYNGTVGMELLYHNIPVLLGSKCSYSNKGFTYEPKNKQDYFDSFAKIERIYNFQCSNKDKFTIYFYQFFKLFGIPFIGLSDKRRLSPNYSLSMNSMLQDSNLNFIVEAIIDNTKSFLNWSNILSE